MTGSETTVPSRASRLLLAERDVLLPILRRTPAGMFDRPTVCAGWSVRDVLAHCGAALMMVADGTPHGFTPEDNERDVERRRGWPLAEVVSELELGYDRAAGAIDAACGKLDGVALGEWVHGGDVRESLGEPHAYTGEGIGDALELLAERSRSPQRSVPLIRIRLPEVELTFGRPIDGRAAAELETDAETLVRLCSGRSPDMTRLRMTGAEPHEYALLG